MAYGILVTTLASGCGRTEGPQTATPPVPVVQMGHARSLIAQAFSPDGKRLFTADSQSVMVWDTVTGTKIGERPWTTPFPYQYETTYQHLFVFVNHDKQVVAGGELWDVDTGRFLHSLLDPPAVPNALSVSSDGRQVIYRLSPDDVCVVDIATGRRLNTLKPTLADTQPEPKTEVPQVEKQRIRFFPVSVVFAPDGPRALMRENWSTASYWDAASNKLLARKKAALESGSTSPDGNYFVTRNWDDTGSSIEEATIWDSRTGRRVISLWEPTRHTDSIKFLPDGQHVVVGIGKNSAELRNLTTGQVVHSFPGHTFRINALLIDPDGRTLETRSCDAAIQWDLMAGKKLDEFRHPQSEKIAGQKNRNVHTLERKSGLHVVPCPDGKSFLASHGNHVLRVDSQSGKTLCQYPIGVLPRLRANGTTILDIDLSPTGSTVLVRHTAVTVLRETETGKVLAQVAALPIPREYLPLGPRGRYALTSPPGDPIRLWNVNSGALLQTIGYAGENKYVTSTDVSFSDNGKYIFAHGRNNNGSLFFWETATGAPLHQTQRPALPANKQGLVLSKTEERYYRGRSAQQPHGQLWACTFASAEQKAARYPSNDQVAVWDTNTATRLHAFSRPGHFPIRLVFSPDGDTLAITWCEPKSNLTAIEFRDVQTGKLSHTLNFSGEQANRPVEIHFVPASNQVLLHTRSRSLHLWNLDTEQEVAVLTDTRPLKYPRNPPLLRFDLLLAADGKHVIADYDSRYAILWNLDNHAPVHVFEGDRGHVALPSNFVFSPDGTRLLTMLRDSSERVTTLWNLEQGCSKIEDTGISSDPNRNMVKLHASGFWQTSDQGKTLMLDLHSGKRVFAFSGGRYPSLAPQFSISPDGKRAIGRIQLDAPFCLWEPGQKSAVATLQAPSSPTSGVEDQPHPTIAQLVAVDWATHRAALLHHVASKPGSDQSVSLWDLKAGKPIALGLRHGDPTAKIFATLLMPDSGDLLTASRDGTAIRWDGQSGRKTQVFQEVPRNATSLELSSDQQRLVMPCENSSYQLWDLATGRPLLRFYLFHGASRWVTVTPDRKAHGNREYVK